MSSETNPASRGEADSQPAGTETPASPRELPAAPHAGPPAEPRATASPQQPPVRWREILAVVLLVVLSDVTIYRGLGFAGYALFFLAAPLFLVFGAPRPRFRAGFWVLGILLVLLAAKAAWCGSWLLVACGLALVVGFAMALSGLCPYVLEVGVFASQTILAGYEGLIHYRRSGDKLGPAVTRGIGLEIGLPLLAFVAFGLLFIVANPDLLASFGETLEWLLTSLREWILQIAPSWQEVLFWLAVTWVAIGLVRPVMSRALFEEASPITSLVPEAGAAPVRALLYSPFRNTLVTVIGLFAVYLVFEFKTLWFREFPEGFYYSGYAHEGAAWLTVALGLATVVLSFIFRGRVLLDARLPRLRRLAWVWSLENVLLAIAVYHRMTIYIGFNGMTRMRTVGLFGMTCVVAGFLLVVWKIVRNRDFVWLMRRHLWALALAVYLFALWPTDAIVHCYNVRRILSGDPAPSVQISVHPISSEGVLLLLPLVDCNDATVREGVRAMLADRLDQAESLARRRQHQGWTAYQIADRVALERLRAESTRWAEYTDRQKREAALEEFHEYAYQWY
ncbi:MAG TPA: DUF4153 domain-containing protein [Thermoguttaceae bacterium]|nr:DUF4153 domain-containing protein [Thermoguttaceae bacterium]